MTLGPKEQAALQQVLDYSMSREAEDFEENFPDNPPGHILLALVRLQMALDDGPGQMDLERGEVEVFREACEIAHVCYVCGGSSGATEGCRACCRDCGFPCDQKKNSEGFHA